MKISRQVMSHITAIISYNPVWSEGCEVLVCFIYFSLQNSEKKSKLCKAYARVNIKQCELYRLHCKIKFINI